jgi:chorismate synthase
MLGLIFGITGWDGERPHPLVGHAGRPPRRPRSRHRARPQALPARATPRSGRHLVQWTFDPLEARNAHINFARLGATAREYIRDCYGASTSPLHRDIGTDRLVAEWKLDSDRVRRRMEGEDDAGATAVEDAPLINPEGEPLRLDLVAPRLWLRIPPDIQALKERDAVAARRWREHTRAALEAYLARGYEVRDLIRGRDESRYMLSAT